jgi:thiol-disulfide isomerase/thioredoxin
MKLILTTSLAALVMVAGAAAQDEPKVLDLGSPAPDFSLKGIDGKTYTLSDFADSKVLCVIFTCNHCPDAVAAATRTEAIHQDYKDKGVALVAVNANNPASLRLDELGYSPYNDSFEEMAPFAADNGWTFPYLYDGETQTFAMACGAQSTPHVFIFDAERKLRYTGRMDDAGRSTAPVEKSFIRNALDAVLAGEEVKEPVTRSFGCSTKWLFKKGSVVQEQKDWESKPVTVADLDEDLARKLAGGAKNVRLINFWSTTCGPCVKEFPGLVETYRRFQTRPFEFISITLDPAEKRQAVEAFLKSRHAAIAGPNEAAVKDDGRTTNNYHWTGGNPDRLAEAIDAAWTGALPHTVLISQDGKILWRHTGEVDIVELRRQVVKALD